ncbi:MAG: peptidylprolyl isomerase [Bacteroidota bacterium]
MITLRLSPALICLWLLCISVGSVTHGQSDKLLFEVEGEPVYTSEFTYIYEKNNRDNADYSLESLEEYLDLYINFKLKVRKAKELGYNQTEEYRQELLGYRRQLADSYVIDREVVDRIVDDVYARKQVDVHLRHILLNLPRNSTPEKATAVLQKLVSIRKEIVDGVEFSDAAKKYSEDKGSAELGGDIGYITAMLPDGYLDLENAAYELEPGQVSQPVRTDLGLHLIQVIDRRPARGKMEVAQILMKKERNGIPLAAVDSRLASIRQKILEGQTTFDIAARTYSEDKKTRNEGGYLGFFGIGEYEKSFEDAAFALTQDGNISEPVETSLGWHVIKRISKRPAADRQAIRSQIKAALNIGPRFRQMKDRVVADLQKEAGYKEESAVIQTFIDSLDKSIFQYNWQIPAYDDLTIQSYGEDSYSLPEFAKYAKSLGKLRLRAKGTKTVQETAMELYREFTQQNAINYAENRLEERYSDFRNLMREYEEGILLFEITKDNVWDRAATDTTGLAAYYEDHKYKYQWRQRAKLVDYSLRTTEPSLIAKILNFARQARGAEVAARFNTPEKELVLYQEETVEAGSDRLGNMLITEGTISTPDINNELKVTTFKKIDEVIPPGPKTLREARGYIISDYQEVLEERWIEELAETYDVKVKRKVLKGLVR